ncbi:MAG: CHAT domain-containing protein [Leptolyngbyaceae cyanobacterium SM2_5_2]|nr:CHAT domain-containing protein [Leptolyngbyaceae cyanobacterium SM2_5_2]
MTIAVEAYQTLRSQIQGRIFSSENWQGVFDKLVELRNLSQARKNKPLEVLTLANLNNTLAILNNLSDNTVNASDLIQENNEDALMILQDFKSPALESYFLLNQAKVYRKQSEPQKALENYVKILDLLSAHESQSNLVDLIGQDFLGSLSDEWQLDRSKTEKVEISHVVEAVRIGLLLDTVFTYSILGDYQAGIYLANSQELTKSVQYLSGSLINFLDDEEAIRKLVELDRASSDPNLPLINVGREFIGTPLESWLTKDVPQLARRTANTIFQSIPEAYRLQASRLLFFDFDEVSTAAIYEAELESLEILTRKQANDLLYQSSLVLTSDVIQNQLADTNPEIVPLLQEINAALPSAYDTETQSWSLEGLEKILDLSKISLLKFLDELEILSGNQSEEVEHFVESSAIFLNYIVEDITLGATFEENTPDYHQRQIELAQGALDSWPNQTRATEDFEWIKGFLFKAIADSHYKLNDFSAASEAYNSSIPLLYKATEFYRHLEEGNDDVANSTIGFLSRYLQIVKDYLGDEFVDIFVVELLLNRKFNALLNSADSHIYLKKSDIAKQLYLDALNLSEQISVKKPKDFVLQQSERAEIFYGIALAESMLGNQEGAKVAINEAIQLNESSFPNESLSGGSGVLSLDFGYGYGVPYQGSISAGFNFESENPWLSISADDKSLAERRCATVTQYFACRQKYFDFYIGLLLQQHQENSTAGFDILAFEASEQAKAFSFKRPGTNTSIQDRFAPARSLLDIQAVIAEDDTLMLQFFLGEKSSYLWLLSGDGDVQTYVLPPRAIIEEKAQAFYEMLTSPPGRARPRTTADIGAELSKMLLGPVASQLETQRLIIVADGFLQYLPFSALPNPNPNNPPSESALLGEYGKVINPLLLDHEIIHLPSASTLVALRQNAPNRPQADKELAFFANPVFNHKDNRVGEVKVF